MQQGVQLHGFFKRTQHDEDYEFFVDLAQQHCGSGAWHQQSAAAADASVKQHQVLQTWGEPAGAATATGSSADMHGGLSAADLDAYELLLSQGVGVFASGISHQQYIDLTADIKKLTGASNN